MTALTSSTQASFELLSLQHWDGGDDGSRLQASGPMLRDVHMQAQCQKELAKAAEQAAQLEADCAALVV